MNNSATKINFFFQYQRTDMWYANLAAGQDCLFVDSDVVAAAVAAAAGVVAAAAVVGTGQILVALSLLS
jgi:hypothetical protein